MKINFFKNINTFRHSPVMGVDISDHSIEILQLDKEKNVKFYGRSILKKGTVENGNIKNTKELGEIFQETLRKTKPKPIKIKKRSRIKVIFSLPESKAFIREFKFESKDNLKENVKKSIKENIPFIFEGVYWDYIMLEETEKEARVLAVAVSGEIVDQYIYFFWTQKTDPVVFDIEAASIGRALLSSQEQKSGIAIIDIGARTSIINIFNLKKTLSMSISISYAGDYFTQKIAEKLKITEEEAEQAKQALGFIKGTASENKSSGFYFSEKTSSQVPFILEECFSAVVKETKNALKHYKNKSGLEVGKIILAGGSALLPGIKEYFQKNFEQEVEIGNPLLNIKPSSFFSKEKAVLFANVIGLAMRKNESNFIRSGVNLLIEKIKKHEEILYSEKKRYSLLILLFVFSLVIAFLAIIYAIH